MHNRQLALLPRLTRVREHCSAPQTLLDEITQASDNGLSETINTYVS